MENDNLYQGDIELDPDERFGILNNVYGSIKGKRWPGGIIPYAVSYFISDNIKEVIPKAIAEFEKHTCLKFVKRKKETEYVSFQTSLGCSSPVGKREGRVNTIKLARGCFEIGTVMHEIGHTLGLYHEQARTDRDSYVKVLWNNIETRLQYNFNKMFNIDSLGTPYDYLSMMHYSGNAFGIDGKRTMITLDKTYQNKIGQRNGLSAIDIVQLNKMYCE